MNLQSIIETLKKDEGFSAKPYWDNDQWTYGYGCKAPGPEARITKEEAAVVLKKRVKQAIAEFYEIFGKQAMTERRQHAIVNMLFNLGKTKFLKFVNTIRYMKADNWKQAAANARQSLWYKQVTKRAERICKELEEG